MQLQKCSFITFYSLATPLSLCCAVLRMWNVSHRLMCLNTWFLAGGAAGGGCGLPLEEMGHREFHSSNCLPVCSLFSVYLRFECQFDTTWEGDLSWEVFQIRLAGGHVCRRLSWSSIDEWGPSSLWVASFPGLCKKVNQIWACECVGRKYLCGFWCTAWLWGEFFSWR